ncbi:MAG: sn-glycerol-3-phosphate ABC transporter ATP-binding protein UgpC [Pirellulaceae bacterium]|nr:sn-glycerol-3-phosphate ABC transporter ATP-binding protein UgpC [Pirellulaceae bacterium]
MAEVVLQGLTKRFGQTRAVNHIYLHVKDQELVVLVGPSGCGKTTALRLIAGLEEADSGEIFIGGRSVLTIPPRERDIAMVFQNYALYPHMTVAQNMGFGLKMRRVPPKEIQQRIEQTAEMLGIEDLLQRKPSQLSGGQRQRVAVGRAIIRDPQVFLLDEPLSNLDAKLRMVMRGELIKLHRRLKATMIYVTHDQVEAMTMGDRIAVMNEGNIQQFATPREIYAAPANRFVAEFIGSPPMNLLEGTLVADGKKTYFETGKFRVLVPSVRARRLHDRLDRKITLGVRPEHLQLLTPATEVPGVDVTVSVSQLLGAETIVELNYGEGTILARLDNQDVLEAGQAMRVAVDMTQSHFFDPRSELRLKI